MWYTNINNILGSVDSELAQKGKEVYETFSNRYIVTPRLLHKVLDCMIQYSHMGIPEEKRLPNALADYTQKQRMEIADFKDCKPSTNPLFGKFQLHTRMLLHYLEGEGEYILTEESANEFMIAINIFEIENCTLTKKDIEDNAQFAEIGLEEGHMVVKVRHLVPFLEKDWKKRLPFNLENEKDEDIGSALALLLFQNGGPRKQFEKLFVHIQKAKCIAVLPTPKVLETSYTPSQTKHDGVVTTDYILSSIPDENFFEPDSITDLPQKDIPEDLKGHDKTVAVYAAYMKGLVASHNKFLVYPQIQSFKGFDYYVYDGERGTCGKENSPPPKKLKEERRGVLYLVQVATGASHSGDTIGQALDIVKRVFSDKNLTIHVVVMVVSCDERPYSLLKSSYENITVLNLNSNDQNLMLQDLFRSNLLFHRLFSELVKINTQS